MFLLITYTRNAPRKDLTAVRVGTRPRALRPAKLYPQFGEVFVELSRFYSTTFISSVDRFSMTREIVCSMEM